MWNTKWLAGLLAVQALGASAAVAAAAAAVDEACSVGYCTLNGGTTGGKGGTTVTVTTLADLTSAVAGTDKKIIIISGTISGAARVYVGSNKTIVGKSGAKLVGIGLTVMDQSNVIIRNIIHQKVKAEYEDAITLLRAKNVWVDHMDMSSDRDNGKDYYDGLVDVTHACDYITISNSYFHDHYKGSLVGHSDNNQAEDAGHLTVTYANNHWARIYSRAPMFRIGTGHLFNNYWDTCDDGIRTRTGAQLLVESSVFVNTNDAIIAKDGYAVVRDVDLGVGTNEAPTGTLTSVPYTYTTLGSKNVKAAVVGSAGATLSF